MTIRELLIRGIGSARPVHTRTYRLRTGRFASLAVGPAKRKSVTSSENRFRWPSMRTLSQFFTVWFGSGHAKGHERFRAAHPIAASNRFVTGSPSEGARRIVPVSVLFTPAGTVFE